MLKPNLNRGRLGDKISDSVEKDLLGGLNLNQTGAVGMLNNSNIGSDSGTFTLHQFPDSSLIAVCEISSCEDQIFRCGP